jgi:hypothetical protein
VRLDLAALLRDAWALWQRDRGLLLPIAGFTFFLPGLASQLLIRPALMMPSAGAEPQSEAAAQAVAQQLLPYLPWLFLVQLLASWGTAIVWTIYLDRRRPTLLSALAPATGTLLRYIAAMVLVSVVGFIVAAPIATLLGLISPALLGLMLAPLFYFFARLMLIGPALAGDPKLSPSGAIRRSWTLTRGHGWKLAWVTSTVLLAAYIVVLVFDGIEAALTFNNQPNPVLFAITSAIAVAGTSAAALAGALIAVAAYRRLSSSGT